MNSNKNKLNSKISWQNNFCQTHKIKIKIKNRSHPKALMTQPIKPHKSHINWSSHKGPTQQILYITNIEI